MSMQRDTGISWPHGPISYAMSQEADDSKAVCCTYYMKHIYQGTHTLCNTVANSEVSGGSIFKHEISGDGCDKEIAQSQ